MKLRFGAKGKAYYNSAGPGNGPTWVEIKNVNGDLSLGISYDSADATIRDGDEIELSEPTIRKIEPGFKMLENLDDTVFMALRSAGMSKTAVDLMFCSGPYTVAGETFVRMDFKVSDMPKGEPMKGINTYDFKFKPCASDNPRTYGLTS